MNPEIFKVIVVRNFIEENPDGLNDIYINLANEKEDKHDPMADIVWEGLLRDIPLEYYEREVISTGKSLKALEIGKTMFYLEMKR